MFKKTLLTSSLFLTLNAMADDAAVVEKIPPVSLEAALSENTDEDLDALEDHEPPCLFCTVASPSGFYFTANTGMTSFNQNVKFQYGEPQFGIPPLKTYDIKLKSKEAAFIGVGFGYLWDINKFATTLEYTFQVDTLKAKHLEYPTDTAGAKNQTDHVFSKKSSHNLNWTIGYRIFNAYTPYIGVGLSRAQFEYYYDNPDTRVKRSLQKYIWGTTFLAGLRVALTEHIQLKIEYQLQNFPKWNTSEINLNRQPGVDPVNIIQVKPKFQTLLFGVSYKF